MANKRKNKSRRDKATEPAVEAAAPGGGWHAFRETIESIVIAFVLAFLFRTFEAEAFVIPTGSMSPSLQGQHKDVCCSECGYRFRTTASSEGEDRDRMIARLRNNRLSFGQREHLQHQIAGLEILAGQCPMCRQTMAFRTDLPSGVPDYINLEGVEQETSYPGDRILVNKYCYLNDDPKRWDVVVFKFPGNGEMNYIKRMIGLPNEEIQLYQGDVFTRTLGEKTDFVIQQKPADKQRTMLQPVHDTDFDSSTLYNAGWPLRWSSETPDSWQVEAKAGEHSVDQRYEIEATGGDDTVAWLRYRHLIPSNYDWSVARDFSKNGTYKGSTKDKWLSSLRPQLIRDFNPYNARIRRDQVLQSGGWSMLERHLGMHWVSDLALECEVDVKKAEGELLLDLVEAGKHFTCRIDLKTGQATLGIDGLESFQPTAATSVRGAGEYALALANVDDRLLLWVDDELIDFGDSAYDPNQLYGDRANAVPRTSEDDPGDLAPAGIGAQGASLTVNRIKVLRDIYYVATKWRDDQNFSDYKPVHRPMTLEDGTRLPGLQNAKQLFVDPAAWPRFAERHKRTFQVEDDQFFVMGDNSPESQDCRLWKNSFSSKGIPGGPYLDRRLLTGKAVCVFWPHSWGSIPGLQKLPGFPNFGDMRIVR